MPHVRYWNTIRERLSSRILVAGGARPGHPALNVGKRRCQGSPPAACAVTCGFAHHARQEPTARHEPVAGCAAGCSRYLEPQATLQALAWVLGTSPRMTRVRLAGYAACGAEGEGARSQRRRRAEPGRRRRVTLTQPHSCHGRARPGHPGINDAKSSSFDIPPIPSGFCLGIIGGDMLRRKSAGRDKVKRVPGGYPPSGRRRTNFRSFPCR